VVRSDLQRKRSLAAPFAPNQDAGVRLPRDVGAAEAHQLGHAQAGGKGEMQHGPVAQARAGGGRRRVEDGLHLRHRQVPYEPGVELLGGNGQDLARVIQEGRDAELQVVHEDFTAARRTLRELGPFRRSDSR